MLIYEWMLAFALRIEAASFLQSFLKIGFDIWM
jgi:hypothetical protein